MLEAGPQHGLATGPHFSLEENLLQHFMVLTILKINLKGFIIV